MDKDLQSIQEARDLLHSAKAAQAVYAQCDQASVDRMVAHISESLFVHARSLAEMAHQETGFGNVADKTFKNEFASRNVFAYIKDMKTRGVIHVDETARMWHVGVAVGVIVGLIPSTNPTATVIYKSLISLKSGNAIVFSPHPNALNCILKTVGLIRDCLSQCGHSPDLVSVLSIPTVEGTNTLMKSPHTALILATGGGAMVKAAYSSGNPALGVGPGNVPAFIERSADIQQAVSMILSSKTFDNGVICASEQAIVVEEVIKDQTIEECKRQGCYFVSETEKKALERVITRTGGGLNPKIVGKSPASIAQMAGIAIPENTRVIVAYETGVGSSYPFSMEKLSPLLAFYVEKDWEAACQRCIELLQYGGLGHSLALHSRNTEIIREFALNKPVSRVLVNTPATHGAIGLTTGMPPALTLGCGAVGGSATSDNVTPLNLINIRRVAFGQAVSQPSEKNSPIMDELTMSKIIAEVVRQIKQC